MQLMRGSESWSEEHHSALMDWTKLMLEWYMSGDLPQRAKRTSVLIIGDGCGSAPIQRPKKAHLQRFHERDGRLFVPVTGLRACFSRFQHRVVVLQQRDVHGAGDEQ
jgi:hypothetical protein